LGKAPAAASTEPLAYAGVMTAARQSCVNTKTTAPYGWFLGLRSLKFQGSSVSTPMPCENWVPQFTPFLFDSGTPALLVVSTQLFQVIVQALPDTCNVTSSGESILCPEPYTLSLEFAVDPNNGFDSAAPTTTVTFSNTSLLWRSASFGRFVLGYPSVLVDGQDGQNIAGSVFMREFLVEFDFGSSRMGFGEPTAVPCDNAHTRGLTPAVVNTTATCQTFWPPSSSDDDTPLTSRWYFRVGVGVAALVLFAVCGVAGCVVFRRIRRRRGVRSMLVQIHALRHQRLEESTATPTPLRILT